MCSPSTRVVPGNRIIQTVCANVGMNSASVSKFGLVSSGHYLLPDQLSTKMYRIFLKIVLPGLLSSCEAEVFVSAWQRPAYHEGGLRQWLNATSATRWTAWWRDCVVSVAISDSNELFYVGIPQELCLHSHSQNYQRSHGKKWGRYDNGRYRRIKVCWRERCAVHWRLIWNGRKPLRTSNVTTRQPRLGRLIIWFACYRKNITFIYKLFN